MIDRQIDDDTNSAFMAGRNQGFEIIERSGSTDANSALALGVPAVTIGAVYAEGAHTRGEWVDLSTLPVGLKIALGTVLQYF